MPTYDAKYIYWPPAGDRLGGVTPYVTRDGQPWIPTVTLSGARKLAKKFNAGQAPMVPLFDEAVTDGKAE